MTDGFAEGDRIGVLTTEPLDRILDYRAPPGGCRVGDFVEVPLGPRRVLGVVWAPGEGDFAAEKLRSALRRLDLVPMRDELRTFLERAAAYTLTPLSAMLRLATRAPGLGDPPAMRSVYRLGDATPPRMTEARARVLETLRSYGGAAFTLRDLADRADVGTSVVKGLVALQAVREEATPRDVPYPPLNPTLRGKDLTEDQARAAEVLTATVAERRFQAVLLKGVTGSGKTEVYLEAIAACLAAGRQALVLLPEIALTAEFLARVEARFGARPAEWHSGATMVERRRCWRMVGAGGAGLVVGARSALFLPFRDLGLVVVDEEHDSSYKQEDGVLYNARDMAVLRGSIAHALVVLASATPSLETWANAEAGKYTRLDLPARYGAAVLPQMRAIDMRTERLPAGTWISPSLRAAIEGRLSRGEQALLFLNRRGFAPVTLCRACGHQIACHQCDARMVEHRFMRRLMCHQCGATAPIPDTCPACGTHGQMSAIGPGVERLAEEAAEAFPNARLAVLSSDLYGSARALKAQIEEIAAGGADIIIGTQLVAKGHNFPNLTLVGAVDTDLGLHGSDLRAAERTFQLIRQVSGRAGRTGDQGLALLQTYQPEHRVIRAILSGEDEAFCSAEAAEREEAGMPPYSRLAGVVISAPEAEPAFELGARLARADAPLRRVGAVVYGPAVAPIARVRGRHRVRLLVQAAKGVALQPAITAWLDPVPPPRGVRLSVDIDPQTFY